MTDLKAIEQELTRTLNLKQQGADEERARIVACLRADADPNDPMDPLTISADAIEADFHWDRTEEELAAECPSCGGLNTSCPDGCGRDSAGELNGSRL